MLRTGYFSRWMGEIHEIWKLNKIHTFMSTPEVVQWGPPGMEKELTSPPRTRAGPSLAGPRWPAAVSPRAPASRLQRAEGKKAAVIWQGTNLCLLPPPVWSLNSWQWKKGFPPEEHNWSHVLASQSLDSRGWESLCDWRRGNSHSKNWWEVEESWKTRRTKINITKITKSN